MDLTLGIAILGCVISVSNFVIGRKDKAVKDGEEEVKENSNLLSDQKVINYRLTQVESKLDKILDILDNYEKEIETKVDKAIEMHIRVYHKEK